MTEATSELPTPDELTTAEAETAANATEAQTAEVTAEAAAADATAAAETAQAAAADADASAQMTSLLVSDLSDLQQQNKLLRDNLDLVFRRLDQLGNVLQGVLAPLSATMDEMDATTELMQQVITRQDEQQEQLAVALVALARITTELSAAAVSLSSRQQPTSR